MRRFVVVVLAVVGALVGAASCVEREATCVPGQQISCACPGGAEGIQVCADDGERLSACDCPGTGSGGGGGSGGAGGGSSCACADEFYCNGVETCGADGECIAGTMPNVNDNDACTYDACSEEDGGTAVHEPVPVDDGDPCTLDYCNPTSGPYHLPDADCNGSP